MPTLENVEEKVTRKNLFEELETGKLMAIEKCLKVIESLNQYDYVKTSNMRSVSNVASSKKFKMPKLTEYTGIECPRTHIKIYYSKIQQINLKKKIEFTYINRVKNQFTDALAILKLISKSTVMKKYSLYASK